MILKEEQKDLFTVPKNYTLVQCVSADFAMGAGIAREFAKRGVKRELKEGIISFNYTERERIGQCVATKATGWRVELNLITKQKYLQKPTYETLKMTLEELKSCCVRNDIFYIAMPKIGCGLDKLEWSKVKAIIEEVFAGTDIEILICYL